ncbi:MAG: hypothetical protein ACK4SZ_15795 [Allosphingosinicella sp.]|uniref:hypothetical protein n=1 Tax=Allosphingosinicella sp. TaxID=2823234 RepID=UPI00393DABAF
MTSRKKGESRDAWESVSIRLPPERVRYFERKAAEANIRRGTYIADLLLGEEPVSWPSLAALARVIAIHETVRASKATSADQLTELRSILLELAEIAHTEVSR